MSRKKDIARIVPLAAMLRGVDEQEARCQLEKLSARKLRARRKIIEQVSHPIRNPNLVKLLEEFDEINEGARKLLAEIPARNLPPHPTVQ